MKRIMIIGATQTQVPLVKTAKRLGYYSIVAGKKGDYPANEFADELCDVDISNPENVLEAAKKLNIDGIATCCMDLGIRSVGKVCDALDFVGLSENAAILSNNKMLMKKAFLDGDVHSPAFMQIKDEEDLEKAWRSLSHPVVMKALDLQASRGIYVCEDFDEVNKAFAEIRKLSRSSECLMEEFIRGIDIGAQAFVYNGKILFVLPHNDEVFHGSANKPIGHSAPLIASESIKSEVICQCEKAIRAIGLDNCAVNIDLLLADDGQVYMIELTGRAGATCLPELVSIYYGIDYYEMIIEMAMGNNPCEIFDKHNDSPVPNASRFIMSSQDGILKNLSVNDTGSDIEVLQIFAKKGDKICKFEDGKDRLGQIVVKGESVENCIKRLDEIEKRTEIDFEC